MYMYPCNKRKTVKFIYRYIMMITSEVFSLQNHCPTLKLRNICTSFIRDNTFFKTRSQYKFRSCLNAPREIKVLNVCIHHFNKYMFSAYCVLATVSWEI